ncbi:MAG: DUF4124 domain-containing protein [Woeseiaceae bacterium]
METRTFFALIGILATTVVLAEDAWKWTDDEGVVHYSDVPVDGAEQVHLSEYSKKTGARISESTDLTRREEEPEEFTYETLAVTSPTAEQTLWNIEGNLPVSIAVSPNLMRGHRIRLYFDGNAQDLSGTSVTLTEVYRGVHNLRAEVIDATGRVITISEPVRFYVQQNAIGR